MKIERSSSNEDVFEEIEKTYAGVTLCSPTKQTQNHLTNLIHLKYPLIYPPTHPSRFYNERAEEILKQMELE